jgi:CheY-like chemotaxis protein
MGDGTGLGLSMVFGIVKMHEGHISCESEPGKGTSFKIYLPVAEDDASMRTSSKLPMPAGGTEKILVVDDEPFIQELAKKVLERAGYMVITAGSAEEAIDIYLDDKNTISLIILDLIMPGIGGKQCLKHILKIHPQAKVLIASGFAVDGETRDYLASAAKGIVSKPFNMRELLRSVRSVLDGI